MLIHRIQISNFKNFDHIDIQLGKVNVIVGANASGKSNFIQALKFIRDIKNYGIENAISRQGGMEYFRNFQLKDKSSIISMEFQPSTGRIIQETPVKTFLGLNYTNLTYTIEIGMKSRKKFHILKEEIDYNTEVKELFFPNSKHKESASSKQESLSTSKSLGSYQYTITYQKGKFSYTSSIPENTIKLKLSNDTELELEKHKISPLPIYPSIIRENTKNQKTLLEQYSFIFPPDLFDFAVYDFDLKKSKEAAPIIGKAELEENGENLAIVIKNILDDKEKARQFSNLLSDILPYVSDVGIDKFYDKSLLLKVKEIYNKHAYLPSSLLSDGTISVTSIITALFFEDKNLAVFEEPEKGVHPALIAKLMQFFYDTYNLRKKQIIITTHSPEILKYTQLEDLLLLSRNENGYGQITKPAEQEMVKAFLENELGIEQLFTQNLLDA